MSRFLLFLAAALLALAPAAAAETLVLKSGKKVKAARLEVHDDAVEATLAVDGGTAVVHYKFSRLDPFHLVDLLERHWIVGQDAEADGAAAFKIGTLAERFGLLDEAVVWVARAAEIHPALAPKRDAALEKIRTARVGAAFGVLEDLLRAKQPAKLIEAADEALAGELGLLLTPAEALRIDALRGLAEKLVAKNAPAAPEPAPKGAGPKPPAQAPGLSKQMQGVVERIDASMAKAAAARDKATDPGISNARARKLLETGAKSLLDARRKLRELSAPLPGVLVDRAAALESALVTTWLDIAELYREVNRNQTARRFLRAARLLDPENERAREIEIKLETPLPQEDPYYDQTHLDWLYIPSGYSYFGRSYRGTGYPFGRYRYGSLGIHRHGHYGWHIGGHGHHHRRSHHHGSRRVVGRRR